MSSDQIAAIRPALVEILGAADDEEWCATFELSGKPEVWVQVTRSEINFAYTRSTRPVRAMQRLARGLDVELSLSAWEPRKYATFSYRAPRDTRTLAKLVDRIFVELLGCDDPDYPIDIKYERLD
jgi:hypothetical protein